MLSLAIFPVEETFATFGMPSNRFLINVGLLHKKPTKIATCSEAIARRLDGRRCLRDHEHEHVLGGGKVTSTACLYTKELANEIILNLNNLNVKYLMKPWLWRRETLKMIWIAKLIHQWTCETCERFCSKAAQQYRAQVAETSCPCTCNSCRASSSNHCSENLAVLCLPGAESAKSSQTSKFANSKRLWRPGAHRHLRSRGFR